MELVRLTNVERVCFSIIMQKMLNFFFVATC